MRNIFRERTFGNRGGKAMKTFKGIIRIECRETGPCIESKVRKDVRPDCVNCGSSKIVVVDHEGEILAELNPEERAPAKTRESKTKKPGRKDHGR